MELDTLPNLPGQFPAEASHHKHFPFTSASSKPRLHRRTRNHVIRATAKELAKSNDPNICNKLGLACSYRPIFGSANHYFRPGEQTELTGGARRVHLENDLRNEIPNLNTRVDYRARRHRAPWGSDEVEGRDLAKSALPLPTDSTRIVRRPSLEREDAFRDANTSKATLRQRRSLPLTEDAQIAELYRMGLLYDHEQDRGEGFSLNSINHDEPTYIIRPAKRARRQNKSRAYLEQQLHLDLSFTDLGDNDAIARYLMSSTFSDRDEDGALERPNEPQEFAPLRVIYEVESSQPSFDVDTSQPPDLVTDLLSDYDCFSDSDLDDLPSQREVQDSAATPGTDAWIVLGDDS